MSGEIPRVWVTDRKVLILWPGDDYWAVVVRLLDRHAVLGWNYHLEAGAVELETSKEENAV